MKNRIFKGFILLCTVLAISITATAQEQEEAVMTVTLTGKVVNESGEAIRNVVVSSFLTKDKTQTNEEGSFTIEAGTPLVDFITFTRVGYENKMVNVEDGLMKESTVVLTDVPFLLVDNNQNLPYQTLSADRNVSAINTITGDELRSYPSISFLDALSGRLPGLRISNLDYTPGAEWVVANVRGSEATFYIDGIQRNPVDLSVYEIEKVEVIKDLSGRALLGTSGAGPIIWVTTKTGKTNTQEINVAVETGLSAPQSLPEYLDAYNYATLYNEALTNDGLTPFYSQTALDAYKNGSDSPRYANVDYYEKYVKKSTSFTRANVNFTGGNEGVNYFSNMDYVGSGGYEKIGQETKYDRYKIRGNVNIKLNDFMKMNVNLSGTYGKTEYPNSGNGAGRFNMFNILSSYPSNAFPSMYDGKYLISDNFDLNLDNELLYGGYAESTELNTKNLVALMIDLNKVVKGLSFKGSAAFDANNVLTTNKGGSQALYRLTTTSNGADSLERVVERLVEPSMWAGYDFYERSITATAAFAYERTFGKSELTLDASYYQARQEARVTYRNYQPNKIQDLGFRANYAYDGKYVLQFDLAYTGNMRLPDGEHFNTYPTVGAAWNASEESFLKDSKVINHLKVYTSYGKMGVNSFNLPSNYNQYYLQRTLWQNVGAWYTGVEGQKSGANNIYEVLQYGSDDFKLPEKRYFNVGAQAELFDRKLTLEINYFDEQNVGIISQMASFTPALYGTGGFLPAKNFGETHTYGLDGLIQYSQDLGDFNLSVGANMQYLRSKNVIVDEAVALADYRKRAGKDADLFFIYQADGLYQTQQEIDSRGVDQSWGEVQPGDIRYVDYNDDGIVNEQDIYATGAHAPRIAYGLNLSLAYKGFKLFVLGTGVADGELMLNNSYFQNSSTTNNYSVAMLNRWPESNDMPRLTTVSQNNYQNSSFWLANAAYLNIKNVQFGYTFPASVSKKLQLRDFQVFLRGKNVATFSEISRKYDLNPEYLNAGISAYPMSRTFTIGLSGKF